MSNQGLRQASVRGVTGTTLDYNGDWLAIFDADGIAAGDFNGRMIAWLQAKLVSTDTEINGLMQAYAESKGADSWNGLGTFTP